MRVKTMLAVAATAAALPLGAAWATQPTGPQGTFLWNDSYRWPAFSAMDRNGDGIVTREEYAAATGTVPAVAPAVTVPVAPNAVVPCGPGTSVACAPVAYAPVVVQPAVPVPHYSWFSADSNPPAPAR
jgi:hypothetical protein